MKILITGIAGFIGSNLAKKLIESGASVVGVDNFLSGQKENVEKLAKYAKEKGVEFTFIEKDICDETLRDETANLKLDQIYNLACPASPKDFENLGLEILKTCSNGVENILEISKNHENVRILHTSTSEVYGDPLIRPQPESYCGNVQTMGPRACYDEGKRYAESLIYTFCKKHKIDYRIARIFNTYGNGMRKNDGRIISNFLTQVDKNEALSIYGDGSQTRSFCYIDDMVEGLISLMSYNGFNSVNDVNRVMNLGNDQEVSIYELTVILETILNKTLERKYLQLPVHDPKERQPDLARAMEILYFKPKISLEEGLKITYAKWNEV